MAPTSSAMSAYGDLNRFSKEDKDMVYDKDMCKSKLGVLMCAFRADRPSEWQMDEFIHHADDMNKKINELTKQRDELLEALEDLYKGYVFVLEAERDRIMDLGGQCDPVYVMEIGDPRLSSARVAIAKSKGGAA